MMLTGSTSNYLQGDYLEPLPTTLDAKNSPLALLAATCNNIGKDDSAKAIIPPIDRNDRKERETSQSHSPSGKSPSFDKKPLTDEKKSPLDRVKSELDNSRISPRKDAHPEHSGKEYGENKRGSPHGKGLDRRSPVHSSSSGLEIKSNTASKISLNCGSLSVEINHKESRGSSHNASTSPTATSSSSSQLPTSKLGPYPAHTGLLSAYYPHLGLHGYPGLTNPSGLLSVHKPESSTHTTVTHATVKTLSGATTLVPVCSDPYCAQCKLAVQSAQLFPSCPPGCTQCPRDEHRSPAAGSLGALPHGLSGLHSLAGLHSGLGSGLYPAHSSLSGQSAGQQQHHVCSWVAGGKYCGERFSTSEELMSHLRTHTSTLEPSSLHSAANLASMYSSLAHPSLALSHLYYSPPPPPGSLSPTSPLRGSSYGRSLSPNTLLASSRFHPYLKSPLSYIPTSHSASLPGVVPPPTLGAYPSLYPLPGSRLGALVP